MIMTTFKTFVFAAMMTVFTTNAFANNNKNNNKFNNHAVKTEVKNHHGAVKNKVITVKEYNMAKHCKCKACKEIVKKYEMQMKHNKNANHCTCANCMKQNKVNVPVVYNANNNNHAPVLAHNTNSNNHAPVVNGRR